MPNRNRTQSGFVRFRFTPPVREAVPLLRLPGGDTVEVALAHLLDVDLAANPFVDKRNEGRIFIDGHAIGLSPVDGALRDGFPGAGVRAHRASTWE